MTRWSHAVLTLGLYLLFTSAWAVEDFSQARFLSGAHEGERPILFDKNTGQLWQRSSVSPRKWSDALSYCQELVLAGRSDWRLPSVTELATLVDLTRHEPAIDTQAFPDTASTGFWTSTTFTSAPHQAWVVNFKGGAIESDDKSSSLAVRCLARWTPNGDGTVQDRKTELLWEQSPPQTRGTFEEAIARCQSLDMRRGNWRLPLIHELRELSVSSGADLGNCKVEDPICLSESCYNDGVCGPLGLFDGPGKQGCFWEPGVWKGRCRGYWSQSAHSEIDQVTWYVDFANSIVTNYDNDYLHLSRCVRAK